MEALCVQIFDAGLTRHAQRTVEVESFFTCSHEAVADNRQKAAHIAADFESSRRPVSFFSLSQAGKNDTSNFSPAGHNKMLTNEIPFYCRK